MSFGILSGILFTVLLVLAAGIRSGRQAGSGGDFTDASREGLFSTTGNVMGTMIGGSATVGTAQMAFQYGFSALWCTLGIVGAFVLFIFFGVPAIRARREKTLSAIIGTEFGDGLRLFSSLLGILGCAMVVMSQLYAGTAVMTILFPATPELLLTTSLAVLALVYILFGGIKSAGTVGMVKLLLLFPATVLSGILALRYAGGFGTLRSVLDSETYFNLFARGFSVDVGSGFSIVFGSLCLQSYLLAIQGAKDMRTARGGFTLCGLLGPLFGLGGVLVGLYMRASAAPEVLADPVLLASAARSAFPNFILEHFPPFLGGVLFMALILAVVGSGAAQSLAIASLLHRDIFARRFPVLLEPKRATGFFRLCILALLALLAVCTLIKNSFILDLTYLSMGLIAVPTLPPLIAALFLPGRVKKAFLVAGACAGIAVILLVKFLALPLDAATSGVIVSLVTGAAGIRPKKASAAA